MWAALAIVAVSAVWVVALAFIALAGPVFSGLTLRAIDEKRSARSLRALYRGIVWIATVYYYVSLPLVAVIVVGAAATVMASVLSVGHPSGELYSYAFICALVVLWATMRSVLARIPDVLVGRPLREEEHPRLRALLREITRTLGTREIDEIRITTGTELAVTDDGHALAGNGRRTLILGIALLEGLRVRELAALVAHELGHLRDDGTARGGLALRVRRAIERRVSHHRKIDAMDWWNPAWWFVKSYGELFARVTQGAARLQEVLADRRAVEAYGSTTFRRALRHVTKRKLEFDAHLERSVSDADHHGRGWSNLYQYRPIEPLADDALADAYTTLLDAPASPDDSHPALADRLAAAKALDAEGEPLGVGEEEEAWWLFERREKLEQTMTDAVRAHFAEQGIVVPKDSEPSVP